ncbi:hypothetical protein Q5530_22325 [Saccharothrix sp. BKS2]|uniref:Uncharacterized protein n=1 Tax=Saccharothrix lopnurensis TaxID=1670621 RepID=A0ABW1P174_9PSEU
MSNAGHDAVTTWDEAQDGDHPAGDMALSRKSRVGGRARALAGMALAVGAYAVVTASAASGTVSAPVING